MFGFKGLEIFFWNVWGKFGFEIWATQKDFTPDGFTINNFIYKDYSSRSNSH
tara:strand:+ start:238 stop:393 length:156 start_codon:yes stop_codon:yes gene_type:complete